MYMYICEHAYVWDEQKGEGGKTPGRRLTVGRLRVLKPFPTTLPSPAFLQSSLHPPSPCFGQCTNITNTCMLRRAMLGSTLCCWPHPNGSMALREPKPPALRAVKACNPAALCVASACATAGTQAQEETRLLAPACRAWSSARTCLHAAHRCCDMHCCALLLSMRCAIIWLKLGARRRKHACMLLRSRARAAACVLHTAAATLIVVRCCCRCGSVDCSGLLLTIVNLGPHCAPIYDSVNVEDKLQ